MTRYVTYMAAILFSTGTASAQDARSAPVRPTTKESQRPAIVEFLRKTVVGKTLASAPSTFKIDEGKVEVTSEEQVTMTNLIESPEGFQYDMTSVSKAATYDIGADGKRTFAHDYSGVRTYRFEFKERRCSHELTGFGRLIVATDKGKDPVGEFSSVRISMDGGKLVIKESTVGYVDFIAAKGLFKPGAYNQVSRISLDGMKVRLEQDMDLFDVDTATLKWSPAKDKMATEVYQEIAAAK